MINNNNTRATTEITTKSNTTTTNENNTIDTAQIAITIKQPIQQSAFDKNMTENCLIGDDITKYNNAHVRLYFQNINSAMNDGSWQQWTKAYKQLNEWNVDVVGVAETNVKWNSKNVNIAKN